MSSSDKQEGIEIIQGEKRFAVISKYDPILIQYFKTLDKRHYNAEKHEWTFPCEQLNAFESYLKTKMICYTKTWTKNQAKIEITATNLELSFNSYIKDFNIFKQIDGAIYDRGIGKWKLPLKSQVELEDLLQKFKFTYVVMNKETALPNEVHDQELNEEEGANTEEENIEEMAKNSEKANEENSLKRPLKKQGGKQAKRITSQNNEIN